MWERAVSQFEKDFEEMRACCVLTVSRFKSKLKILLQKGIEIREVDK